MYTFTGNDFLNSITSQSQYQLRIDMEDFDGESRHAVYTSFVIASEGENYKLTLGQYSGTAGDCRVDVPCLALPIP